ncbi:MAG: hypothetical protein KBT36_14865 [Kurthia sp.]|nr:hypothetical protein [Candidatus Kurthia equi]
MSKLLYLWKNFSKRKNSTKLPPEDSRVEMHINLKSDCSLEHPIFLIDGIDTKYNYCAFDKHCYFIDDIVCLNNNIFELHCSLDLLATHRTEIGNYTAFVERSASNYDIYLPDPYLSSAQKLVNKSTINTNIGLSPYGLYQILVQSRAGVKPYVFDSLAQANAFYNSTQYTTTGNNGSTIEKIVNSVDDALTTSELTLANVSDHSSPMMWLPINPALKEPSSVNIGIWNLNLSGYHVNSNPFYNLTIKLNTPTNVYSDFRKYSPSFSRYTLFLPSIGLVSINPIDAGEDDLYCDIMMDCISGAITYRIYHQNGNDVATFNGQIGVQIACGNTTINAGQLISTAIGAGASILTGGAVGAVAGVAGGLVSTANAVIDAQSCITGGSGNITAIQERYWISFACENYGSKDYPTGVAGRPLMQNVKISTLSGFVKCSNASIPLGDRGNATDVVNSYLNNGFYYE